MQQYLDKLNTTFNKILTDNYISHLWEEFSRIVNECYNNDIRFYYVASQLFEVKESDEMMQIKKEMEETNSAKLNAIKIKSFEGALKQYEHCLGLEMKLDRAEAKAHYKTENYFYKWDEEGIGFNFTGNKVIDFLMKHYSTDRWGLTMFRK